MTFEVIDHDDHRKILIPVPDLEERLGREINEDSYYALFCRECEEVLDRR